MIYIGCSGWSYQDWKNIFYPAHLSTTNHFSYYAAHFNTVEINNTFYHFPREHTIYSWMRKAPNNFKFSFKVNKEITHIKKMRQVQELLLNFYRLEDILQDNLGCFLFQFPSSFRFTKDNLAQILKQLNPCYKNVLEFRHPSWWVPDAINPIRENNIVFCTVSGFDLPEDLIITNEIAYIRFHGNPAYMGLYTEEVLLSWIDKIKKADVKELYIYFNNTMHAHAVKNASLLKNYFELD
jgi:uncharacterized protein YecE (DUF72 family)